MSKCDGCIRQRKKKNYKGGDYLSNCSVDWFNIGLSRKHCPCKECILKVNCSNYCDCFSNFYYRHKDLYNEKDKSMSRMQQAKKETS